MYNFWHISIAASVLAHTLALTGVPIFNKPNQPQKPKILRQVSILPKSELKKIIKPEKLYEKMAPNTIQTVKQIPA